MLSPRTKRTGSADGGTLSSPRSLFKSSNSDITALLAGTGQPPLTAEALSTRGRPIVLAHLTILAANQGLCDSQKLKNELSGVVRPALLWTQQQMLSRHNLNGNPAELRRLLSEPAGFDSVELASALVGSDSVVTDFPIAELAVMCVEEHVKHATDEHLFFGARRVPDVACLLLERMLKLSPVYLEVAARLKPMQNPDTTNVFELLFQIVSEELQQHRLPQLLLFVIARVIDLARRDQILSGLLCLYVVALCDAEKAKSAARSFFIEALPGPKVARRPSIMGRTPSPVASLNSSGSIPIAAPLSPPPVTLVSEWTKTSDKIAIGKQKKCSECQAVVSEVAGQTYLFTSMGEKTKRFVCGKCIVEIKKKIQSGAQSGGATSSPRAVRYSEVLEEHVESMLDAMFE
jgi:hypothetical protein